MGSNYQPLNKAAKNGWTVGKRSKGYSRPRVQKEALDDLRRGSSEPMGNKPKKSQRKTPKKGIITKCYHQCTVCHKTFAMDKFWAERTDRYSRITCGMWRCTDKLKPPGV